MIASADSVRVISPEHGQGEIISIGHKKLCMIQWANGKRSVLDKQTICRMPRLAS